MAEEIENEIARLFKHHDSYNRAVLTKSVLKLLLVDLNFQYKDEYFQEYLSSLEDDGEYSLERCREVVQQMTDLRLDANCRNAFTSMDFSCTGVVSMKDIRDTFAMITKQAIIERKEKIVTYLNGHKKETINIKEFIEICRLLFKSKAKEEIVYVSHTLAIFAFEALDSEKKGAIDTKHVKDALNLMMFKNVDQPEDFYYKWDLGKEIDMDEFFDRMKENREHMTE